MAMHATRADMSDTSCKLESQGRCGGLWDGALNPERGGPWDGALNPERRGPWDGALNPERTVFMSGDIQEKVRRDHSPALASGLMLLSAGSSAASALNGCASQKGFSRA